MKADKILPKYYTQYDRVNKGWTVYERVFEEGVTDKFVGDCLPKDFAKGLAEGLNNSLKETTTKTFTQISNQTFDLSYGYHDNVLVLTVYHENGDEDTLTFDMKDIDDFYDLCVTFSEKFNRQL